MRKRIAGAVLVAVAIAGGVALKPKEGCGAKCCHRASPEADCKRRDPHSGQPVDFGDATMVGSHAVGNGCVPAECVVGRGIEWLEGGSP